MPPTFPERPHISEKRIVCKAHQNLKGMIESAESPFLKNEEWRPNHKGGPLREAVAKLCGISASTVGRITREADGAGGILVSSQAHGPRKKSPSEIALKDSKPITRDIKGPLYIRSRWYDLRGHYAVGRRSTPHRACEHIGRHGKLSDYGASGAAVTSR